MIADIYDAVDYKGVVACHNWIISKVNDDDFFINIIRHTDYRKIIRSIISADTDREST